MFKAKKGGQDEYFTKNSEDTKKFNSSEDRTHDLSDMSAML